MFVYCFLCCVSFFFFFFSFLVPFESTSSKLGGVFEVHLLVTGNNHGKQLSGSSLPS